MGYNVYVNQDRGVEKSMATREATVRARVEPKTKRQAEKIFKKIGLTTSDAIRLFLRQVTMNDGMPFALRVPNEESRKAMKESRNGIGKTFQTTEDLYNELGI